MAGLLVHQAESAEQALPVVHRHWSCRLVRNHLQSHLQRHVQSFTPHEGLKVSIQ